MGLGQLPEELLCTGDRARLELVGNTRLFSKGPGLRLIEVFTLVAWGSGNDALVPKVPGQQVCGVPGALGSCHQEHPLSCCEDRRGCHTPRDPWG